MSFGENLLSLRKSKGISQDELGAQLNVSRQTVSKWELNDTTPDMDKLIKLSEYFDVSIDELVKGKEESDESEQRSDKEQQEESEERSDKEQQEESEQCSDKEQQEESEQCSDKEEQEESLQQSYKSVRNLAYLAFKIVGIGLGTLFVIDLVVMIIFFLKNGFPPL